MKVVHSDSACTWFLGSCPNCDLPLVIEQPIHCSDPLFWRADGGGWVESCPRCESTLPELDYDGRVPVLKEA